MSNVQSATHFLINTLFGLYIYAVILRVLLQLVRADFYNPLSQFIWKVTNPPIVPLRRLLPRMQQIDTAGCLVGYVLVLINLLVIVALLGGQANFLWLMLQGLVKLVWMTINLFTFAILIQAIMSWFGAGMHSPASTLLWNLNEPLLRPVRRILPPIGGLDLSPLLVIIGLQVVARLLPLYAAFR